MDWLAFRSILKLILIWERSSLYEEFIMEYIVQFVQYLYIKFSFTFHNKAHLTRGHMTMQQIRLSLDNSPLTRCHSWYKTAVFYKRGSLIRGGLLYHMSNCPHPQVLIPHIKYSLCQHHKLQYLKTANLLFSTLQPSTFPCRTSY